MLRNSAKPIWTREVPGQEDGVSRNPWGFYSFNLVWDAGLGRKLMVHGGKAESMSVKG